MAEIPEQEYPDWMVSVFEASPIRGSIVVHRIFAGIFSVSIIFAIPVFACSASLPLSNSKLLDNADAIVRAAALEYASPPSNPRITTTGVPESRIRFKVLEVIRGSAMSEVVLPGYLSGLDDFNDEPAPFSFVRPNGRRGSCFANTYRLGGQFLLFLKKSPSGELTVNWYALGPVNEQLHSENDPWLLWVRQQAREIGTGNR